MYNGKVIAGFAGGTADAFTLFERFESKLQAHNGNLTRAAVELAKDWRTDRMLRRLEALLIVADATASLLITNNGDVVDQENDLIAIGSGGAFAKPPRVHCWKIPSFPRVKSSKKVCTLPLTFAFTATTT